jgi:hypothetical protein
MSTIAVAARIKPDAFVLPKNLLANGGFEIWQRGTGPFTGQIFSADEWKAEIQAGATFSVSKETTNHLSGEACATIDFTSGGGNSAWLAQCPENYKSLSGKYLTFSVWVKTSVADCVRVWLTDQTSGGGDSASGSIHTGGGDWERLTVTKLIRDDLVPQGGAWPHGFGLQVYIVFDNADASGVLIDNAMLVEGYYPEGVPFVPLSRSEEFSRIQRFYQHENTVRVGDYHDTDTSMCEDNKATWRRIYYATRMKATASVTLSNVSYPYGTIRNGSFGVTYNASDGFSVVIQDDPSGEDDKLFGVAQFDWKAEVV